MDECKPLRGGVHVQRGAGGVLAGAVGGRGLHSFTVQLNLSRVCHKNNTLYTLNTL